MSEQVDKEIEAIKTVLNALGELTPEVRDNVLDYVLKRLGLNVGALKQRSEPVAPPVQPQTTVTPPAATKALHIKEFKNQKNPKSANEMAAVVAYYLVNLAPPDQKKTTVNAKDMDTYFKIADFPLPGKIAKTLPNARGAGYFDLVGDGEYRLNPVGHNLVAHSMPRGSKGN